MARASRQIMSDGGRLGPPRGSVGDDLEVAHHRAAPRRRLLPLLGIRCTRVDDLDPHLEDDLEPAGGRQRAELDRDGDLSRIPGAFYESAGARAGAGAPSVARLPLDLTRREALARGFLPGDHRLPD